MFGANAPVDKANWSPPTGKPVVNWAGKDAPGWACAVDASQAILTGGAVSRPINCPPFI